MADRGGEYRRDEEREEEEDEELDETVRCPVMLSGGPVMLTCFTGLQDTKGCPHFCHRRQQVDAETISIRRE